MSSSPACEECHQANEDSESHKSGQAAAVVEEQPASGSSSVLEVNPQSPSGTETISTSQGSSGTSLATLTYPRSHKKDKSQDRKCSCFSEGSAPEKSCSDILTKVDLLEQFILKKHKKRQPILKEDMLNLVGEDCQDQFADILKKACERIEVVFAIDVKEVNPINHSYALVSKVQLPHNWRLHGRKVLKNGLLINILCLIFMNGRSATEEEVWKFLNKMKVYAGKKHFIYGEPRRIITKYFVQLKYLEYRLVPNSDPPCHEFLWGPKAHSEISKKQVLDFLAKLGDKVFNIFLPWYEEGFEDEETAQATDAARAGTSTPAKGGSVARASRASLKAEDHLTNKTKKLQWDFHENVKESHSKTAGRMQQKNK